MNQELINYKQNIQEFLNDVKDKQLDKISFLLDLKPTFELNEIPFQFKYAHSVCFHIEEKLYILNIAQTSFAFETFWVREIQSLQEYANANFVEIINEPIDKVEVKEGVESFYYSFHLETAQRKWWFIAGEIYETWDGDFDYNINDEMILAFNDSKEFGKFGKLLK